MRVLELVNNTGTTVVMATHDTSIVNAMRRRVVELVDGRIIRDEAAGTYLSGAPGVSGLSGAPALHLAPEQYPITPIYGLPVYPPMHVAA
jgi:cell division transport system ATP-binding protein